MSRFHPKSEFAQNLRDKVVVLTGGATGIGAASLEVFLERGAKVVFGDVNVEEAQKQIQKLSSPASLHFLRTDVTKYSDIIALFDFALEKFSRVDIAVSNAGVVERGNWVNPELSLEEIKAVPDQQTLDVNLLGSLYFARIAAVYLRQGQTKEDDKSLIFLSSIAGFIETSGMPVYQATKHAILGLMRCLRTSLPQTAGIRVNAICPCGDCYTVEEGQLPINLPIDVATVIADIAAEQGFSGNALFVEGGRAWKIEKNIDKLRSEWLGQDNAKEIRRGNDLMGSGEFWQS